MAEEIDIFEPLSEAQRQGSWIDRPGIRSALLQAGLQMLMPTAPGTSPAGNIASAIGQGGEAFRRAVGTRIAQRKQKESEVESESQTRYRDALTATAGGGGKGQTLTLSQRLKAQRDAEKEFNDWLDAQAEALVASGAALTPDEAMQQLQADRQGLIQRFKERKALAQEATGQNALMSSAQVMQDIAPQMAQLKQLLAAGDERARAIVERLKASVVDPENIDAFFGGLSE